MQHTGAESGAGRPQRLLLLAFVLGALLAVPAAGLTFTVQDRSVAPNGTVVVPIAVADAQDIGGVDLVRDLRPGRPPVRVGRPGQSSPAGRGSLRTRPGRGGLPSPSRARGRSRAPARSWP